jgi:hypothetical protein
MTDPIMLLRILREWNWTSGNDPRDKVASSHPLYPGNNRVDGYGTEGKLWAEVDAAIAARAQTDKDKP